jgi:hypothetical protein
MRIKLAIPDHLVTPEALEAALEATTLANEQAIVRGEVEPCEDAIARGIKWRPETFTDGEHFDLGEVVARRGWGDCDDLAPWLAGSMRASGEDPDAVPRVYKSGPSRWHVVVQTGDGKILDPSRWAGMGKKGEVSGSLGNGVVGAIAQPFAHPGHGAVAVMPHNGRYVARCDVPYPDSFAHLASHASARDPDSALIKAINGAFACGECIGVDCDGLSAVGSILLGNDYEDDEIGFLPALAALAPAGISLAKGLFAKKKKRAPPGATHHGNGAVSVPVRKKNKKSGNDQHMFLSYYPAHSHGPVVMRF